MKRVLKNKTKIIISISLIMLLIIAIILSNYLSGHSEIISLAGKKYSAMNSNVVQRTVGSGLESAYVEWQEVDGASGYNVYVSNENNGYTRLDNELIRKYSDGASGNYWRADAVGLKAGNYKLKVVPIIDNQEDTSKQFVTESIAVVAHDRTGFAWVDGETTGAYNMDGTLKDNANVIYITQETKDIVSLEVQTNSDGRTEEAVGLQNILDLYKKGYESKPLVIRFIGKVTDPSVLEGGDIVISGNGSDNRINCGITLEGIGEDATLYGYGIRIKNATNVEIRNIAVMLTDSSEGDNIGLQQENDHIWVHNCDFFYGEAGGDSDQAKGDGALDCKKSTYVTFSYNHFWDSGKSNLLGLSEDTTDGLYITYHHNWYDHSDSRHPRIRFYSAHVYNNYYDGNSKYGVGACLESSVLVEGNYFRNCKKPMMISMQGSDTSGTFSGESGGMIKAYNNYMVGQESYIPYSEDNESFDAYEVADINDQVPSSVKSLDGGNTYNNFDTSSIIYTYKADTPEEAVANIEKYAGRLNGGDFQWNFDDSVDDESDSVNEELKQALEDYESQLLSVGGSSVEVPEGPSTDPGEPEEPEIINVESVTLNTEEKELKVGEEFTLVATINPDNATNKNVSWSTENSNIATVDDNGVVTAIAEGTTEITVTTEDGQKTATCTVTVKEDEVTDPDPEEPEIINVESVTLNTEEKELKVGEEFTLVATINPDNATNKNVSWSTENSNIATVDDNGVVTAIAEGTTEITVTTEDGQKTATCTVTVKEDEVTDPDPEEPEIINVESVTLNTEEKELKVGEEFTLVATINPDNATNKNVSWSTENSNIATVDDNGVVTAIAEGTTEIIVTTEDGNKEAKCLINVTQEIEEIIATISYDNMQLTNQNVTAKITFNRDDVVITNNEGKDEYTFEQNGEFTFEYQDGQGNISQSTAKVNWIDKEVPEINIEYQTIENGKAVNVVIQSNEELLEIPGWTLSEDRMSISKTFYENSTETLQLSDLAGNVFETIIEVDSIDENEGNDENNTQNNSVNTNVSNPANKVDNTLSSMILPSAGGSIILKVFIFILVIAMIGFYIKYKNLKHIIK